MTNAINLTESQENLTPDPYSWNTVVAARNKKEKRPIMTDSMVYRIENNQREKKDSNIKLNTEKITKTQYNRRVNEVFDKARHQIGIAPITNDEINKEIKKIEKRK